MKRNAFLATLLSVSLMLSMFSFMVLPAAANNDEPTPITIDDNYRQHWIRVKTDIITILFPANGKKPMFLWWYSNDTNNVYVMKYKGLIEFLAFDEPYYLRVNQALAERIRERLQADFIEPKEAMLAWHIRNRIRERLLNIAMLYDLHPPFLPFSACEWNLTGPVLVPKGDNVYCVAFNFTLTKAPPRFSFAENNVIIRCRFYNGSVEESTGTYNYTVGAGQMKMDLVVRNWTWNIDKLQPLFNELEQYGINVPPHKAKLALWINLASINIVDLNYAEDDIENSVDNAVETKVRTTASNMVFGGRSHGITKNDTATEVDEKPITLRYRLREQLKMHFAKRDKILAGFFSFVSTANVIDPETGEATTENVTASYIAAGGHMRLFLCYPYFGNKTLEHDPLIGVEYIPPFVSTVLILILVVAAGAIGIALAIAKWKRKTVNIVGAK